MYYGKHGGVGFVVEGGAKERASEREREIEIDRQQVTSFYVKHAIPCGTLWGSII